LPPASYIKDVELPRAEARHKNGEIEVVPVLLYPMDLEHDCEFLYQLECRALSHRQRHQAGYRKKARLEALKREIRG
jgi:hypothetical protein